MVRVTHGPLFLTTVPTVSLLVEYCLGNTIDKKLLSTINKILIDKLSIRSFCY